MVAIMTASYFVDSFREAAPYIHELRGKTLIIGLSGELLAGNSLPAIAKDLHVLSALGIRLVLIHGQRPQINALLPEHPTRYHNGIRISDEAVIQAVKQASGMIRSDIEAALLSAATPMSLRNKPISIASGNFVSARPLGILDGIDMEFTGRVRKVDTEALQQRLNDHNIVLISPLGHSLSGKTFNLSMAELAETIAIALKAEKLIYLIEENGLLNSDGSLIHSISATEAKRQQQEGNILPKQTELLKAAIHAVENGVTRCQMLNGHQDGSLLQELFTRQGIGTSIAQNAFVSIRPAHSRDIPSIIELIQPLEEAGILLKRSREYLENHIHEFSVLENDRNIDGCVTLKPYPQHQAGELACLVVSPSSRDSGYGEILLEHIIHTAKAQGLKYLFALSTQTGEWFQERGFLPTSPDQLPPERQIEYQANRRHSAVYYYPLNDDQHTKHHY